ncbi:MAG: hypothetical protein ACPGVG_15665, partial [Mycobacterium sp.]
MPAMPGNGLHWEDGRGWVPDAGLGAAAGAPEPLGPPPPLQDARGGDGGDGRRAPKPVLPFNTELPQWARGGPVTPETFSAESSWLDKRHDLEEKRAYVNQLASDVDATEAERLDARNAVIEAERDMQEQDMRLQETKRKAYEDFYKQGKETTDQFGELASAVQLDEDLGISRGLVGLADNLFKFLAGLAAAPLKGLLAGIENRLKPYTVEAQMEAAGGRSGGGGAGVSGMFGSLQNSLFGAAGAGGTGGYAGDAALLANVPSGRYTQGERGDLTQGLADCSSAVEDLVNLMDGRPTAGAEMWTGNASDWLTSRGFMPGSMPGAFNVGFNSSHMQATLPGGTNFNWGTQAAAQAGGVAPNTGAFDPAFTQHFYRPVQPTQQQQQPPWSYPQWQPRANGGGIPGSGNSDTVPTMLTPGEHVLTTKDVAALGGQSGVYGFRNALHRNVGGPIPASPQWLDETDVSTDPGLTDPAAATPAPAQGPEDVAGPSFAPPPAPAPFGGGTQVTTPEPGPVSPDLAPQMAPSAPPMLGPDGSPVKGPDGRPLGMDGKPIQAPANPQDEALARLAGFIPKAAKANTVAGTSNLSRIWMTGAEVVNGLIDQGASAASTAVSAAITGASFGAGAAGASQAGAAGAQFAIGLGTEAAKRGVSYWAQMGGIASDAIVEQMFPFGAPSAIGFDSAQNSINGLIEQDKKSKRPGGVYDSGGMLEPGGVAVNMSKRPEPVLTQQQWDIMANTQPAQASHGINIENISVSDVDELSRSLSARQRLASMQYTGRPVS